MRVGIAFDQAASVDDLDGEIVVLGNVLGGGSGFLLAKALS